MGQEPAKREAAEETVGNKEESDVKEEAGEKEERTPQKRRRCEIREEKPEKGEELPRGLAFDERFDIKWDLEEDGLTTSRWWGCRVLTRTTESYQDRAVYNVMYEPYANFDEAPSKIAFLSEKELYDLESDARLLWKLETDPSDIGSTTMVEVQRAQEEMDEEIGESVFDLGMQEFSRLSHERQRHMASTYRSFADNIKEHLRDLLATNGPGYEITDKDISNVILQVQAEMR
mmetsp:Transcript_224/g.705  ORF Transcript_224/g.705 Transcript_224/m.705 type:complete len:232 (-) Transcript_224:162-857(-)